MALTYGTNGVKQKSWRVFIAESSTSGLKAALDAIHVDLAYDTVEDAILLMLELGECRDDSIVVTGENGESIEGNTAGNITINKNCAFSAELINATIENIDALELLDGVSVSILLVENGTHNVAGFENKTCITIQEVNMSYGENIQGGDTTRGTVNVAKTPKNIGNFRSISDVGGI